MSTSRLADFLSLARIPLSSALAAVAVAAPRSHTVLFGLFAAAVATDVADGWWARRTATESDRGARLDSIADAFLTAGAAIAVTASVEPPSAPVFWWAVAGVTAVRMAVIVVTWTTHRVVAIMHTHLNRATGGVLAVAVGLSLWQGQAATTALGAAAVLSVVACVEELAIVMTAAEYDRDRRAWHLRTGPPAPRDSASSRAE